jgi:hypothetical protein
MIVVDFSSLKNALSKFTEFVDQTDLKDYNNPRKRHKYNDLGQQVFLAYLEVGKNLLKRERRANISLIQKKKV